MRKPWINVLLIGLLFMASLSEIQQLLQEIRMELPALVQRSQVAPTQIVVGEGLSDISRRLGLIQSGEFRSGNGIEPGDGFSGMRMGYPTFSYSNELWNLVGINNDALQVGIRASDGTLWAGAGAVRLTSGGILIYNGATQTGAIETDGDVKLGSNISAPGTTSFIVFSNDQTYNGESLGAGDILIGDNSAGKVNLFWDKSAGKLSLRHGTNILSYMDSDAAFAQIGLKIGSISQDLLTGAVTAISFTDSFGLEEWDDANFWTSSNPTRIVIPYTGQYEFQVKSQFANNTTGQRFTYLQVNGSSPGLIHTTDPTGSTFNTIYTDVITIDVNAGDYVEVMLMQNSGGTITGSAVAVVRRVK